MNPKIMDEKYIKLIEFINIKDLKEGNIYFLSGRLATGCTINNSVIFLSSFKVKYNIDTYYEFYNIETNTKLVISNIIFLYNSLEIFDILTFEEYQEEINDPSI